MNEPACASSEPTELIRLARMFDSTHPADHAEAAAICATCPALEWCDEQRKAAHDESLKGRHGPRGTWAGNLYGTTRKPGRPRKQRAA